MQKTSKTSSVSEREVLTVYSSPSELEKSKFKSQSKTVLNDQCIKRVHFVPGEKGIRKRAFLYGLHSAFNSFEACVL